MAQALSARGLAPSSILTGQHPGLDPRDFGFPDGPFERLECPGEDDPHAHVRNVTEAILPMLGSAPDLLIVQGDTSSALGAALAGFSAGIPVAHVEAGLRTHDPQLPWPEEEYRTAIDANAQLLFAPTDTAASNLRAEAVAGEIHVTGNTGIDALLAVERGLPTAGPKAGQAPRLLITCHRRESWGEGLRSIALAAIELAAGGAQCDFVLHPNPAVAESMIRLMSGKDRVSLLQPCSHRELIERIRAADLVLSDSGGIQEEAPALGAPLLVLREKTERPEGVETGNAILVGTAADRIVSEATRLLADREAFARMAEPSFPYGDGNSGPRIATIIEDWLERRDLPGTDARMSPGHPARHQA